MSGRRTALTLGSVAAGIGGALAVLGRRSRAGRDSGEGSPRARRPVSLDEAKRIRSNRLDEMKSLPYDELARYCDHKLACEVIGRDDVKYAHETSTFYDDRPGGLIRVFVEVWAYDASANDWTGKLAGGGLLVSPGDEPPAEWLDENQG